LEALDSQGVFEDVGVIGRIFGDDGVFEDVVLRRVAQSDCSAAEAVMRKAYIWLRVDLDVVGSRYGFGGE